MAQHRTDAFMATAGMFDGVHAGHRHALEALGSKAAAEGLRPLVFTFTQHPLTVTAPDRAPRLLTTLPQREALIKSVLPDAKVVALDPSSGLLSLTSREFLKKIKNEYGVEAFAMGFNNHIGRDRASASQLQDADVPVAGLPEFPDCRHCSSSIRQAIAECRFSDAERSLGHPWEYIGKVEHGKQLGRSIGFPTANVAAVEPWQLLPPTGVYAVDVALPDGSRRRGMANIGYRPTVDASGAPLSFEIHILDVSPDLYDKNIGVRFLGRIRDEKRFGSLEELQRQLQADAQAARRFDHE